MRMVLRAYPPHTRRFAGPLGCQAIPLTAPPVQADAPMLPVPCAPLCTPNSLLMGPQGQRSLVPKNLSSHGIILRRSEQGCDYCPCCVFARVFHPRGRMELTPTPAPFGGSGTMCPHPKMNHAGARRTLGSARLVLRGQPGAHLATELPRFTVTAQMPTWLYTPQSSAIVWGCCVCAGGTPKLRYGAAAAMLPVASHPSSRCAIPPFLLAGRKGKCNGLSDRGKDRRCLDDVTKEGRGRLFVQLWGV